MRALVGAERAGPSAVDRWQDCSALFVGFSRLWWVSTSLRPISAATTANSRVEVDTDAENTPGQAAAAASTDGTGPTCWSVVERQQLRSKYGSPVAYFCR
jgi:hypothetical protein